MINHEILGYIPECQTNRTFELGKHVGKINGIIDDYYIYIYIHMRYVN